MKSMAFPRRPWLARGPQPCPQRPPWAQWPLHPPSDVDHPATALPHLSTGPWRPCPGGAHSGHPARVHIHVGVLVFLDCPCRYSSTASVHSAAIVSSLSSSRRAERGWGAVAAAVAVEGDVVRVLALGVTRRQRLHGAHPDPLSTTRGRGASLCGPSRLPAVSLTRQRPCLLVLLQGFPLRLRGLHLPAPHLGLSVGTRRLWLLPHHGPDTAYRSRLDCRFGCHLPHYSRPWYTLLRPPSFLSPFVHHGRKWFMSSCQICGCRWRSWFFSSSWCSRCTFYGWQPSFYSSIYSWQFLFCWIWLFWSYYEGFGFSASSSPMWQHGDPLHPSVFRVCFAFFAVHFVSYFRRHSFLHHLAPSPRPS